MAKVRTNYPGHAVSAVLASLTYLGAQRQYNAEQGDFAAWPIDRYFEAAALPFAVFVVVFFTGHSLLRERNSGGPGIYSLLGCLATWAAFLAGGGWVMLAPAVEQGIVAVVAGCVTGLGLLIGHLHMRSAGYDPEGDDPAMLATTLKGNRVVGPDGKLLGQGDLGLIKAGTEEYYQGPLRVKTSFTAAMTSAIVGGGVWAVVMTFVIMVFSDFGRVIEQLQEEGLTRMGQSLIFGCMVGLFFLIPFIYGCHYIARWRGVTSYGGYAKIGAITPIVIGLAMFVMGLLITIYWVIPLAVAMAAYRHLAGLEPVPLPEDIEVRDRRTLIGGDHVRRQVNRVAR